MGRTGLAASLLLALAVTAARCQGGESPIYQYPPAVMCPLLTLAALGADTTGQTSVVSLLEEIETAAVPGMHYVSAGKYKIDRLVELDKPVVMQRGARFVVAPGASLKVKMPLTAGHYQVFEQQGNAKVLVGSGMHLIPEWFGAKGNGIANDAPAINRALQAANDSACDLVFSDKTYGIRAMLYKGQGMRIFSRGNATLKALVKPLVGMYFEKDGHMRPDLLPSFLGFSTALRFDDVGMTDVFVPLIAPAPGFPCSVGMEVQADSTRIKFGTIRNCVTGVHVTTRTKDKVVMQGFTIDGGEFVDTVGVSKEVYKYTAPNLARPPYWDHNHFTLRKLSVSPKATNFAMVRSNLPPTGPGSDFGLPMHTYEVAEFNPLPPGGKLIDSNMWDSVFKVQPKAPVGSAFQFKDGQLDYSDGNFNSIQFLGPHATSSATLRLASTSGLGPFKSANSLAVTPWQNVLTVVTPMLSWTAGQKRRFYLYHQLAYNGQCLFLNVPGWGSRCINGDLAVTALTDNSLTNSDMRGAKYEVVLDVVACKAVSPAKTVTFKVAIGAVGS